MNSFEPLLAPLKSDEHHETGGVHVDIFRAGNVIVKRMIYEPGFNFAKDLSPVIGSRLCMHAHVGFMAKGQINVKFADGCIKEYKAPEFVSVEPGHEGWVVGDEPAVLIEFAFENDTVSKLGVEPHKH